MSGSGLNSSPGRSVTFSDEIGIRTIPSRASLAAPTDKPLPLSFLNQPRPAQDFAATGTPSYGGFVMEEDPLPAPVEAPRTFAPPPTLDEVVEVDFVPVEEARPPSPARVVVLEARPPSPCRMPSSPPLPKPVPVEMCSPASSSVVVLTRSRPVEELLARHGYRCLSKLTTETEGQRRGHYLKCQDQLGNVVYVKPDIEDGFVTVELTDPLLVVTEELVEIPHSARKIYFDLAAPESAGVAIEARCGICFLGNGRGPMKQEHFMYGSATLNVQHGSTSSIVDVVPIVSLRDILADPRQVLQNTEIVSARIVNKLYDNCRQDVQRYSETLAALTEKSQALKQKECQVTAKLRYTTDYYRREAHKDLTSCEVRSHPNYRQRHECIMYNLEQRNRMRVELVRICRTLGALAGQLEESHRVLCDLGVYLDTGFQGVEGLLHRS